MELAEQYSKTLYIGDMKGVELQDGEAVRRWIRKVPETGADESAVDDDAEAGSSVAQPGDSKALQQ